MRSPAFYLLACLCDEEQGVSRQYLNIISILLCLTRKSQEAVWPQTSPSDGYHKQGSSQGDSGEGAQAIHWLSGDLLGAVGLLECILDKDVNVLI